MPREYSRNGPNPTPVDAGTPHGLAEKPASTLHSTNNSVQRCPCRNAQPRNRIRHYPGTSEATGGASRKALRRLLGYTCFAGSTYTAARSQDGLRQSWTRPSTTTTGGKLVTLVHLSDIHFKSREHETQFDVEQHIRRALLEDLSLTRGQLGPFDGLLISGDIAFSGQAAEYDIASTFLSDVFARTGIAAHRTFVVPGNHDVDRSYSQPEFPLAESHRRLRATVDPEEWRQILDTQLRKDPLQTLLKPLDAYNNFAQGYDCPTVASQLAWTRVFDIALEDGTLIRIHGLNSALLSDHDDRPSGLLVSELQTAHLARSATSIEVLMCHHPPDWLMDRQHVREILDSFICLALFGHEHSTAIRDSGQGVHLFAGAVQPSKRDPGNWLPTYHVIQLSIDTNGPQRTLVTRIHTREFSSAKGHRFVPRVNSASLFVDEYRKGLQMRPTPSSSSTPTASTPSAAPQEPDSSAPADAVPPSNQERARHELLVQFFRMSTPLRYSAAIAADLVRDGDDAVDPRAMWALVFQRAIDEDKLSVFWTEVSRHSPDLAGRPNPFER